jgi:hypothetical protein
MSVHQPTISAAGWLDKIGIAVWVAFNVVERELRREYDRTYPDTYNTWDRIKGTVQFGWDRVTANRTRTATA